MSESLTLERPAEIAPLWPTNFVPLAAMVTGPYLILRQIPGRPCHPEPVEVVDLPVHGDVNAHLRAYAGARGIYGVILFAIPVAGLVSV